MKTVMRFLAIALISWGCLVALSKVVRISPEWPLWAVAITAASVVELILKLYRYEAGAVSPRRARWIIGLRLLALAVLIWILIEPVWVRKVDRETMREVVVILDDSGSMRLKDEGSDLSRIQLGEIALEKSKLVENLRGSMRVRIVKAAGSLQTEGEKSAEGWEDTTNLASALGTVLEQVPPDELAGVVMVTDGRHNRPERVEEVARRFGILDAPIGLVAVGSNDPPKDAAVLNVRAPEAIHLGDRMRVVAELKFDGYKGQKATVSLRQGGKILETRDIPIPQDQHREEVRFANLPEAGGVNMYRIEINGLPDERFAENNHWDFETSITDARTNVLIVESFPRWEFRYLRNLFYGRDKSVHLQYVLMNPDQISAQADAAVPASAARPFGDALATRLPASEEEWRKFDVIILGDLEAKSIDETTWQIISRCVNERAALLIMIAGPRSMPHAINSAVGRALVPAKLEYHQRNYFNSGSGEFRFGLTREGQNHPLTQQSDGTSANERIWSDFPSMSWRHPVTGLMEGSEVLLTAGGSQLDSKITSGAGLQNALDDLTTRRDHEAKSALLVTRQTGKGKVALLLTDRTWRLREGAGDLYHHRFWGNLVRWGAGPVLRSGGNRARLGTDQLIYTPDDRVKVTARLRDETMKPMDDPSLEAEVVANGQVISKISLTAVQNSNGLYEANLERLRKSGKYEIRLRGKVADRLIKEDGSDVLKTSFQVVGSRGPIELAETTLNRPLLETIAGLSGGKVVGLDKVGELASLFQTDQNQRQEIREISLWDSGWVLGLIAILLGSEWVIRRAGGLP